MKSTASRSSERAVAEMQVPFQVLLEGEPDATRHRLVGGQSPATPGEEGLQAGRAVDGR